MTRSPVALVTGGNRGLGLETCRKLAERGHRVILTSRKLEDAERAARELAGKGRQVEPRALNVADPASVAGLAGTGKIDALVNNAGATLSGFNAEVAEATLDINFFGAMRVTDALLPALSEEANIVMVSSGMGELSVVGPDLRRRFASPDLGREELVELVNEFVVAVRRGEHASAGWPSNAYRVSKVTLNALTRILARELRATKIKVNAVCPGWVRTRMGGRGAARSVEEGASGIVWAATLPAGGPSGGFFRDGKAIEW
jgi:NAD(P)-dependent dehydrogenase (short-subunit alcohol dehydrogenase family)